MMTRRRALLVPLLSAVVASLVVIGPALADELLGVITAVNTADKKITVVEKGTEKEVIVSVTDTTELVTPKGSNPVKLDRIEKSVNQAKEKGRKGMMVKITHDKGTASKIEIAAKKAPAPAKKK